MNLKDKVAIVTGGARGIGEGIARCLAGAGAKVAIVDLDGAAAQATATALGGGATGYAADVSHEAAMTDVTAKIVAHYGGLDVLVNNAGGGKPEGAFGNPFTRVTGEAWDDQMTTNLRTAFAASKAAIPHLQTRGGGSIVNIASIAGQLPVPLTPAYGAAKAAMISLTRSLALELAPKKINVNAICPGLLWTRAWEMIANSIKAASPQLANVTPRDIFLDRVKKLVPMGTEQTPDDVGQLAVFLCSAVARQITGQAISVDGGITLKVG
jgi:NAD(P)-dependent dehydrogenase (short-subunit alcohol dehydrogenase family)